MQDNLIDTLLCAALQETGAQRGWLILWRRSELRIAAEAARRHGKMVVRRLDEVVSESLLPKSVLYDVLRTRESTDMDNGTAQAVSAVDPFIDECETGSVFCLPLFHETKFIGILVLENQLASGVFAPAQIRVLKLVASLAASAIENLRLYGELQEREAKMRRLADANILGLYIVDLGGPILEANDAYLGMLGYERRDFVSGSLRWTDLTPPEWRDADIKRVEKVKRVGRLQPFEKEFFRKDGTRIPVLLGAARLKKTRNQAIVFALDMSKQKRAAAIALEARTIERTRIARKLHEAVLQNFQGMMYRFQAARNLMTRHPEEALLFVNDAIHDGEKALDQSRQSIRDFR